MTLSVTAAELSKEHTCN